MIEALKAKAQTRTRPFIIPTLNGFVLAGVIFTLFLMGLVYANNLALLLSFSLVSFFLAIMFKTHEQFNSFKESSYSVVNGPQGVFTMRAPPFIKVDLQSAHTTLETTRGNQSEFVINASRGVYAIKRAKLWTNGEWDLFHVWRYVGVDEEIHIYPTPIPTQHSSLSTNSTQGGETFSKHERYLQGHQSSRIDWKVYARSEELFIKDFEEQRLESIKVDYDHFSGEKELKLSQMAWLINQAYSQNNSWNLTLPSGVALLVSSGHEHYLKSMELLSEA
ncbi:MAG: DUF58 domain-containing protein [Bacteriovoracaceae bacterium]|nr:DUF58 domain-containing protein [Bacteriovoracaceae bacterium]